MTELEERLRSLRQAGHEGPTASELRNRATRRRTRRRVGSLTVGVIGVISLGTAWAVKRTLSPLDRRKMAPPMRPSERSGPLRE